MKNNFKLILILCLSLAIGRLNAQTTFNYTGSVQTYIVPACATQVTVTVAGAQGGEGQVLVAGPYTDAGGEGGTVIGVLNVVAGSTLDVYVGGQGGIGSSSSDGLGGFNGGADGYYSAGLGGGGGGGGASDIRVSPYGLANRVVVAGGGGGGGANTFNNNYEQGGPGGAAVGGAGYANDVQSYMGYPGSGGTAAAGGAGGTYAGFCTANSGSLGLGGADCSSSSNAGGGGGGGYYGGGGGVWAGAGGGSNYTGGLVSSSTNSQGTQVGNGVVIITPNAGGSITLTPSQTNPTCNNNNGIASVAASGGTAPYTYLWTPTAQTTSSATALTAGTYTVDVHDACGNTATASITLVSTGPSVTASTTNNETCRGGSTGAVSSNPTGGTLPYTYSWNPGGAITQNVSGLSAGSYTITVKDHNGCSASAVTTITQPALLSVNTLGSTDAPCNGQTGTASTTVSGGTGPYTYTWAPSGGTNGAAIVTAGTYTVTVKDACGATSTATATITQPAALVVTGHVLPTALATCTGKTWVTVSGGTAPYTYSWSPGGNSTDSVANQCAGKFCCKVTDAHGCIDSTCVTVIKSTGIEDIESGSGITVYPNPTNGQFTIEASGISGQASVEIYNVLGQNVYNQRSTLTSPVLINLTAQPNGVYFYLVRKEDGNLLGEGKLILQK